MKKFWNYWDKFGVITILLIVAIVFFIIEPKTLEPSQIATVFSRSATTGIAACGMMFAIVVGGMDLSVGSIVSLVTCVVALNMKAGMGMVPALLLGLGTGVLCGLINGIIITKMKIQAFVATLATQLAFAGVALVISDGAVTSLSVKSPIKLFVNYRVFGVISLQIIMLFAFAGIAYYLYTFTPFGTKTRAIGSNETAARTTGINADRTVIGVFIFTGISAAVAGILYSSRLATGNPLIGVGFELDAITSVILGGTALAGGKGNVFGTLIGAVLLTFVQMALNIVGVGEAYQKLAVALVLLFALAVNGIKLITYREVASNV